MVDFSIIFCLLVREVDGDSIRVDDFSVYQDVAFFAVKIGSFQLGDIGAPHGEEHVPLVGIESHSAWLAQPDRKDRLAQHV